MRRRAAWTAGAVGAVALVAVGTMLLPKGRTQPVIHLSGREIVYHPPKTVAMTPARRRAIDQLLDAFVPAAVERRRPADALPLVTPAMKSSVTRAEWAAGNLPVIPYQPRATTFHGWRLVYSYANEISVDLFMQPSAKNPLGPISYTGVFKRLHGKWLVDSFVPAATFAPVKAAPKVTATPDFTPGAKMSPVDKPALDARWLLVPAAILALIVLVPVGVVFSHWRRGRRAWRAYRLSSQ